MHKVLIVILFSWLSISYAFGQAPIGQIVQSSYQKINSGNIEEAIGDLNRARTEVPNNFAILTALGFAHRSNVEFEKSVEYFKLAHIAQLENARGMFNLGVAYALAYEIDLAFDVLMNLKGRNIFNITNIGLSPADSILSKDSRYGKLFPSKKEYSDPFLENGVEIIHDWAGENRGDQFGWIARNIGDLDEDGIMDLTTSAPYFSEEATNSGKVYAYSGKTGVLLWSFASKDENGQLGMSIEAAGDVNGDGIPDIVAGAPYVNKVLVFSGSDGRVLYEWIGKDPKGAFGRGVKGVGDTNNDGFADILIGEPFQIWGAPINGNSIDESGNAYLYSGGDGSILQQWQGNRIGDGFGTAVSGKTSGDQTLLIIGSPSAGDNNGGVVSVFKGMEKDPFFLIESDSTGSDLGGMFMSIVGDVNSDGIQDVYASDFSNAALGNSTGRAYIHSGADGKQLYVLTGEASGDGFGIGVADAGDIDKDGHDDLVIGAWQYALEAPSGGKVYVYSGKDGSLMRTITGKVVGETLGFDTTGIGDVDGNGIVDLLLTSAWSAINGVQSGRMMIVSGKKNK